MEVNKKTIGSFREHKLKEYEIINDNGITVKVLNLGGIITEIKTVDKNGKFENIVLSYENKEKYIENPSYYGALIGRTSGRIGNAKVFFNDKEYKFDKNYAPNSGHGGKEGFDKKIWCVKEIIREKEVGLELSYLSKDGEEGYPGNVEIKVEYLLNNNDEFLFKIEAESDEDTLLNMTNHSYFNLSGNYKEDINTSLLQMNCDEFLEVDKTNSATGKILKVEDTPFDFRVKKSIGRDILEDNEQLKLANGYDHAFLFNNKLGKIRFENELSGRVMEIETNQSAVVIYTTNFPDENSLITGNKPRIREAICFETQAPPISADGHFLDLSILKKGEKCKKETKYKWSLI